ncbi:hypothetical protein B296_00010665, partial [Ensete ventricosum]
MVRSSTGVAGHGQAPCKGGRPRPRMLPRPTHRGSSRPQWATPAARAAASRGNSIGRRSSYRRARAVTVYVGATAQRGQEGLRQSFCEKNDPAPSEFGKYQG